MDILNFSGIMGPADCYGHEHIALGKRGIEINSVLRTAQKQIMRHF